MYYTANCQFFETEIANITNENYQAFVKHYLTHYTPNYFWKIGASSTGKFHPAFSQGVGGLVRHTKAVSIFCEELLRMSQWAYMTDDRKDLARVACILHDTCKYGVHDEMEKENYKFHATAAAFRVKDAWQELFDEEAPYELVQAIRSHMGQWSTEKDDRPFTPIDRLVHMADYIASRNFIDIPSISEEWDNANDTESFYNEANLPF